jgi:hypothetical protein
VLAAALATPHDDRRARNRGRALCELKTIRADYRAMSEAWRRDKRAIIDICVAHADIRTLQAILDHLEKSCDWTRWPAEPPGLRAGAVAWAIGLREQMFGAKQQIRGRGRGD